MSALGMSFLWPIVFMLVIQAAQPTKLDPYDVPDEVQKCFRQNKLETRYEMSAAINPFYLRGDFDGDGRVDYAVLVREKESGKEGIAICRGGRKTVSILGSGTKFHGADRWGFDAWHVYGKRRVERGVGEAPPPRLLGEAILIEWEEKASALIYWNGKTFAWYQQGD